MVKSNGKTNGGSREARLARKIKVTAKENPRRKGTAAYKFHEAMAKSKTVGDYQKRFREAKARRDAMIWLSTSVKDGYVKVAA